MLCLLDNCVQAAFVLAPVIGATLAILLIMWLRGPSGPFCARRFKVDWLEKELKRLKLRVNALRGKHLTLVKGGKDDK